MLLPLPLRKDFPRSGGRCRAVTKGGVWHRAAMTERAHAVSPVTKVSSAMRNLPTAPEAPSPRNWQNHQVLTEGVFFCICLSISSIPHFCQRCKGRKSAWNQGIVRIFYNRLIFCLCTAHICMLCAIRQGTGAISLCKDALVFGMGKPVYYGYRKQQTHRKTSGAA